MSEPIFPKIVTKKLDDTTWQSYTTVDGVFLLRTGNTPWEARTSLEDSIEETTGRVFPPEAYEIP